MILFLLRGRRLAALPNQQDLLCPIIRGQTVRKACPPQPKHLATAGQQRHQRPFSHRNFCLIQIFFERFANVDVPPGGTYRRVGGSSQKYSYLF